MSVLQDHALPADNALKALQEIVLIATKLAERAISLRLVLMQKIITDAKFAGKENNYSNKLLISYNRDI